MKRWRICLAVVALFGGSAAGACTIVEPPAHELDPAAAAVDRQPPGRVVAHVVAVKRGRSTLTPGSSCDDLGFIELQVDAVEDDRTAADQLGYRLMLTGGELPRGLSLPPDPIRAGADRRIHLSWLDRILRRKVNFDLTIQAVDKAGNAGAPSEPIPITN